MKRIDDDFFVTDKKYDSLESHLQDGEKILWRGKAKRFASAMEAFFKMLFFGIIWLAVDSIFIVTFINSFINGELPTMMAVFVSIFFFVHLMPVYIWIISTIKASRKAKDTVYAITNTRIVEYSIKATYIKNEILLGDLYSVNIKRSHTDKLLRVGDIYIVGKSGTLVMFDQIEYNMLNDKLGSLVIDSSNKSKKSQDAADTSNKCTCDDNDVFFSKRKICSKCSGSVDPYTTKCPYCGAKIK